MSVAAPVLDAQFLLYACNRFISSIDKTPGFIKETINNRLQIFLIVAL